MKKFLIPLSVVLFIFFYPAFEYQTDCPSAYLDREGNELCTGVKTVLWEAVALFSLYHWDGISMSTLNTDVMCCYNNNAQYMAADEANYKSIFPFTLLTGVVAYIEYRRRTS
tara:strand:+ start:144 stop:479 length:336 start_codon:yes stop_codon:yes gene_type:complete